MEAQLKQIRDQQKNSWNKFSPGWRKWDEFSMDWLKPLGDHIIAALDLKPTDAVLDIASGTGEPGLTIAAMLTSGKVVLTDVADGMLEVARDNAAKKGIENYETVVCDVCELPFADDSFNAISCRLGFMFFPDMLMAAKEMRRVLKPGGKIATAVWGLPQYNFWVTSIIGTVNKYIVPQPPVPGAPGMFRCAQPGLISGIFSQAGFQNISDHNTQWKMVCGTGEFYWEMMNDMAAPVVAAFSQTDDKTIQTIKHETLSLIEEKYPDGKTALDCGGIIISAEK